ncbi:MAG: X-Pro aminopeptidase [Candidatus Amoebophilus sp. 36-38]|nr:MAG: X-Pro aminopeptidase [Candidatus Amoebophilus sp. 36-38]
MLRYAPIHSNLFINNRKRLIQHLEPNSLVVLNANDIMPSNGDGILEFRQNSDLFYLSGIDQEETILLIYPDAPKNQWKEIIFVKETNEHIAVWEGQKYTQEVAQATSGISSIHWLHEFENIFHILMEQAEHVYLNSNEHIRANSPVETRDRRFTKWCKDKYPLHKYERLAPIMHQLRMIKSEVEIELIRQACSITEKGFRRILPLVKPGIMEYEIEAELIYEFIRNRSRGFAYAPIIASGANACVLHYNNNNQSCEPGTTILLDVGAEYANYCSDLTRVIPVSGRFTIRQQAVYQAVLRIMRQAQQMLVVGNDLNMYHQALVEVIEKELIDLGLLSWEDIKHQDPKNPAYKKYFMHGVSHHLGLNVHDVGNIYQKFKPGMVFTIEPGIYIREEGLGIRLENNYVIREQGLENLMEHIPIELDEIEELMQQRRLD